jgi:6,7-dimethyl-8-ribityllumazine synthase
MNTNKISDLKVGIVTASFNSLVTQKLHKAAKEHLIKAGFSSSHIFELSVPGSYEVPLAAKYLLDYKGVEGVVCLGAIIEGETDHYTYVCQGATHALTDLQMSSGKPMGFGILMTKNLDQALERAGGQVGNKGEEAAQAVVQMILLKQELRS